MKLPSAPCDAIVFFLSGCALARENGPMKSYAKVLFSILAAVVCTTTFAADKPSCKKTRKNCPMNDKKECNCGKDCGC